MGAVVRLHEMVFYGYHGVYKGEEELGQRFEVDIEYHVADQSSPKTDQPEETIDYVAVVQKVQEIVTQRRYNLIETLANVIAEELLALFPITQVIVRVRKPWAPIGAILDSVEVEVRKEAER